MDKGTLPTGALIAAAGRAFLAHWKLFAVTLVGVIVAALTNIFLSLPVLALMQAELTRSILAERGLLPAGDPVKHAGAAIGVELLVWTAVAAGCVVFVLPGLYIMLRLFFAVPLLLAEDMGVGAALTASWRRTAGQEVPLFLATIIAALPAIGGLALVMLAETVGSWLFVAAGLLFWVVGPMTPFLWACIAASGYAGGDPDTRALAEVFS